MNYFSKMSAVLLKIFPQTKPTAVRKYLESLSLKGEAATIHELSEKFKVDEIQMNNDIIRHLENAGKIVLSGFETVYREEGIFHLAKYTGTK